jgi:hypothetical protein
MLDYKLNQAKIKFDSNLLSIKESLLKLNT